MAPRPIATASASMNSDLPFIVASHFPCTKAVMQASRTKDQVNKPVQAKKAIEPTAMGMP